MLGGCARDSFPRMVGWRKAFTGSAGSPNLHVRHRRSSPRIPRSRRSALAPSGDLEAADMPLIRQRGAMRAKTERKARKSM